MEYLGCAESSEPWERIGLCLRPDVLLLGLEQTNHSHPHHNHPSGQHSGADSVREGDEEKQKLASSWQIYQACTLSREASTVAEENGMAVCDSHVAATTLVFVHALPHSVWEEKSHEV